MIAVVIAIAEEVRDYLDEGGFKRAHGESTNRFYESPQKPDVVVVEGGVGRDRAEMATGEVIERYSPELLISAGFAGAVKPGLRVGDLFVCDRVWSVDGDPAFWKPEAASTRKLVGDESKERLSGKIGGPVHEFLFAGCLSVGVFVGSSSLKGWIGSNFPVSVIDMESFWVSQLAAEHGIPHVVLRSVLDPMEETLPQFVGSAAVSGSVRSWLPAVKYMVSRPLEAPHLLNLARQTKTARASLSNLLTSITSSQKWSPELQASLL